MIMVKKGFSLIESLIYCCIMAILGVLVAQFFVKQSRFYMYMRMSQQRIMMLYAAQDLLVQDLQRADSSAEQWDTRYEHLLICGMGIDSYGWILKNTKLYRITGQYNFNTHSWHNKSTTLVADHITHFGYALVRSPDDTIMAVQTKLAIADQPDIVESSIALFNGELT
jgi:type II secretory pathway pseudopilin PulG